jgi:hypothetical protein
MRYAIAGLGLAGAAVAGFWIVVSLGQGPSTKQPWRGDPQTFFQSIHKGMTLDEVEAVLGAPKSGLEAMSQRQKTNGLREQPHGWFREDAWQYPFDSNIGERLPNTDNLVAQGLWEDRSCAIERFFDRNHCVLGAGLLVPVR